MENELDVERQWREAVNHERLGASLEFVANAIEAWDPAPPVGGRAKVVSVSDYRRLLDAADTIAWAFGRLEAHEPLGGFRNEVLVPVLDLPMRADPVDDSPALGSEEPYDVKAHLERIEALVRIGLESVIEAAGVRVVRR